MKNYISLLRFLGMIVTTILAGSIYAEVQIREWYAYGGLSLCDEDPSVTIGSGVGVRAGLGLQWSRNLAFELAWDSTPKIDENDYKEYVLERLNTSEENLPGTLAPERNGYLSMLVTSSVETSPSMSLTGKIGVARFWTSEYIDIPSAADFVGNLEEQDYSAVVVVGWNVDLPLWESTSFELTLTHFAKRQVKASFVSASIKFPFPK